MKIDPTIAQEVGEAVGSPVPRPGSEAFDDYLVQLDRNAPTLAEKLRSGMIFPGLGDLETKARQQGVGENRVRWVRRTLLMHYDGLEEAYHLSKLKLLSWVSLGILSVMAGLFLGLPYLQNHEIAPEDELVEAVPIETTPAKATALQDEDPFQNRPEEVAGNARVTGALVGSRPLPVAATEEEPPIDAFTSADEPLPLETASAQQGSQSVGASSEAAMLGGDPVLPTTADEEDLGLGVYRAGAAEGAADASLALYRTENSTFASQAVGQGDPFAQNGGAPAAQDGPIGLAAYRRADEQEEVKTGLQAFSRDPEQASGVRAYGGSATAQLSPTTKDVLETAPVDPYLSAGLAFTPSVANRTAGAAGTPPYVVGDSLAAALQIGVVAVGDAPLPVLARADDSSIWQGQANLNTTGRVDVRFSEVLTADGQYPVTAVAQSDDGYLGLPAQVSEATPALASDLARGALRGLSDYVQALGDQTEVRLEGGTPIITQDAPPLEASIAGSVAQLFTPPDGDEQQALVRLAQVPAGTPLKVVVLAASRPAE